MSLDLKQVPDTPGIYKFFSKNKISEIFIILDGIDQIYKKKSYPTMQKGDVLHLIKREIASDPDKDSIKNFLLFEKKKDKWIPINLFP